MRERSGSSRPWLALCFSLALASLAGAQDIPPAAPTDSPRASESAAPSSPPSANQDDLAASLRRISAMLRSESGLWSEDSEALLRQVEQLEISLAEVEAERLSLRASLDNSTSSLMRLTEAHQAELAATRADLELQITAIVDQVEAAQRAVRIWRALTMAASGAATGALLAGPTGALVGLAAGAVMAVFIPL